MKKIILITLIFLITLSLFGCTQYSDSQVTKSFVKNNIDQLKTQFNEDITKKNSDLEQTMMITDINKRNYDVFVNSALIKSSEIALEDVTFFEDKLNSNTNDDYASNMGILINLNNGILCLAIGITKITKSVKDLNEYTGDSLEAEFVLRNNKELATLSEYYNKNIKLNVDYYNKSSNQIIPKTFSLTGEFSNEFKQESGKKAISYLEEYLKFKQKKLQESIEKNDSIKIMLNGYMLQALETVYK